MKILPNSLIWRGLIVEGAAAVFGMPRRFDLASRLSESSHIRLATAFAHVSGWNLISNSIDRCRGKVDVLVGLDFFQTEPTLLRTWLKKSYQSNRFNCKVVTKPGGSRWTFHPKVLIVAGPKLEAFAVIGSGNLSAGGFRDNIECSPFTDDPGMVSDISEWFDRVAEVHAARLEEPIIRQYEPLHEKYRVRSRKLIQQTFDDLGKIDKEVEAKLRHWHEAVSDARAFFKSDKFIEERKECQDAILRIRAFLNYPSFEFDYDGLRKFLKIKQFGNLATLLIHEKELRRDISKIGQSFRVLIHGGQREPPHFEEVFSGSSKVKFIGLNVLTKVLTAHDGEKWPVYNSKVEGVLRKYGFETPRGLTAAQKYIAYATLMREFAKATGAGNVYALDRFFLHASRRG